MIDTIPLSWLRSNAPLSRFKSVKLPLSGLRWIHSAGIPYDFSFEDVYAELVERFGDGILIRGCRTEIARFLTERGFGAVRTGVHAVIDLENRLTPVMEIPKRAGRNGGVVEIPFTESAAERVSRFWSISSHGRKPRLRYLFHTAFVPQTRCFVYRTFEDRWFGAVTVSMSSEFRVHTEMILRDKEAPPGVMETIFLEIMDTLKGEGFKELSLGEVPFVSCGFDADAAIASGQYIKERFLYCAGHLFKYAYNFKSLFRFKNKFRPSWEPVYICAPKISLTALADLFLESRFCALSGSELISAICMAVRRRKGGSAA